MKVRIGVGLGVSRGSGAGRPGGHDSGRPDGPDGASPGFGEVVDALEESGFASLWCSERLTSPTIDPLVALSFAAGRTTRIKLGTSVLVVPGRNPVVLAKQLGSLASLSKGRLLPAFDLGAVDPAEQQAFGVERSERAGWIEEVLPLLRRLWSERSVDHSGTRFSYESLSISPKPPGGHLDVWLGGRAPSELRRTGRLADGWLASFCTPEEASAGRDVIESAAAAAGRQIDPEHFGALVSFATRPLSDDLRSRLARVRPAGAIEDVVPIGTEALRERIEAFVRVGVSKLVLVPLEPAGPKYFESLGASVLDQQRVVASDI